MAFSQSTYAVTLLNTNSTDPPYLEATSIDVMRVSTSNSVLRLYGVTTSQLIASAMNSHWGSSFSQGAVTIDFLTYTDSTAGSISQLFEWDLSSAAPSPLSTTGVRATRAITNNASEYVVTLEYQGAGQTPIYSTVGYTSADLISISYRDPNVLYLESIGQYIMLCVAPLGQAPRPAS